MAATPFPSQKILLTGDRPTGPLHLGHWVGSLQARVQLQDQYETFIMVADTQALTDNFETPFQVRANALEVVKDYLAVGICPQKSTIFLQSQIPELAELAMYFLNIVTLGRLERNPTVKAEIQQKGYGDSIPAGFFCYPVYQAADITAFQGEIIPVGEDQIPMLELTNEIVRRFNRIYNTTCLRECQAHISPTGRLVGIDGQNKASKSLGNAIFLQDDSVTVKQKVWQMFTDPKHLRIEDPGTVENNVVFAYLDAFHPNKETVEELKAFYRKGGLGDTTLKNMLYETLENLLQPIRERRQSITQEQALDTLLQGCKKARHKAQETLEEVRKVMGLSYA